MTQLSSRPAAARARTLTEALRARDQEQLTALLAHRPDLAYPLPHDLAELSGRASTATSIARALDQLDVWRRLVAEALAALPDPSAVPDVVGLLAEDLVPDDPAGSAAAVVAAAVAELRERALLWGDDDQLHLVRGVREYFEPYPGGLAPPSVRALTPDQVDEALAGCDDSVRPLLERLLWSPTGAVRNAERTVHAPTARSPLDQLLARQLLKPLDSDTVILPREVSWRLRDGHFAPARVSPTPPVLGGRVRTAAMVDQAAAGAAFGILHDVELAAHSLEASPHRLLRTGGLSARDMAALARNLASDPGHAGFVMECASVAGLVAPGTGLSLLPTSDYDRWVARDAPVRWRALADAWLRGGRHYSRSTEPGAHVLGPEADAPAAPVLRRLLLQICAEAEVGTLVDPAELADAVGWHYPRAARSGAGLEALVEAVWREAGWLGLTGLGAVSGFTPAVLDQETLPTGLLDLFPTPVEQVIVQADLTAVAPGPLPYDLAADLRLLADQESRGGGGVYRFSADSVRRGYEAGWSSTQIHQWLEAHSSTGVPQPLAYLIDDMARQYGSIRVGTAVSYLRVDDPAQAGALLAAPEATALGLRQVGPGVLLATAEASDLVGFLRARGHAPAVEDDTGSTISAPAQQRAPTPRHEPAPSPPSAAEVAGAVLGVERRRSRHRREDPEPGQPPHGDGRTTTEETLRELQAARGEGRAVHVRYVDADGLAVERELSPVELSAGMMRALDAAGGPPLSVPLARISSVWPLPAPH